MTLSEKKRLQIIASAEALFASSGLEATSMDQIAAHAGVSKRTVYNHFATKTELFAAILEAMFSKVDQGPLITYDAARPVDQQLTDIARQEVAMLASPAFLQVARVAFLQLLKDAALAQAINKPSMGCLRYLEPFLKEAVADKALDITDSELAAKQFVFQLKSLIFYPLLYSLSDDMSQHEYFIEETVKLFMARYRPLA
ncbi:TetR/AcrR family transcriptional regulator [Gilvimarinus algae]|uniref:TetR/AcrR family transcriptional regulator n=1 Tax=Gilvimarinus algae TaxID=3058037 RepID=A0ABT8TFV3_9GAMM|nr:TetR/AcrR family transcriptional regulator [Gilvimarinus sp. SDUM040014]MDO3381536.1 TetR/AcrR family transcriptional regulator [Gilvimarinus sp. SDUM040014]